MAMKVDSEPRITLPGFGLPINTLSRWRREGKQERFPHAIADFFASSGVSLRERRMLDFINQITDKPEWTKEIRDPAILDKWEKEAVRWDESLPENGDWWLSKKMFAACILELEEKAKVYEEKGFVAVLDVEATIVKSDGDRAVSAELCGKLKESICSLENVPERFKDWRPGSDGKVLDLVHPSLFPLVFELSRVLPTGNVPLKNCMSYIGKGETLPEFTGASCRRTVQRGNIENVHDAWGAFQWLPSNIKFTDNGASKIDSYINNLHPELHGELYKVLEQFVDASIPLWNECLSWFHSRIRIPILWTSDEDFVYPEDAKFPRDQYRNSEPDGSDEEATDDEDFAYANSCVEQYGEWFRKTRTLKQPEPTFIPHSELLNGHGARPIDLRKDFAERGLQVIFKLANIHLTPENSTYDGGSWHVEGTLSEHICATALYYYDCENVTDSHLAFRQSYNIQEMAKKIAPNQHDSAKAYFGIRQNGPSIFSLGSVLIRPNRLLAFPNVLQHQVQPFSLADKSAPGHRKSWPSNVPPQRRDWWTDEVRKIERFAELPQELFNMVVEGVREFPMNWEDAVEVGEQLVEERGKVEKDIGKRIESDIFSFWGNWH